MELEREGGREEERLEEGLMAWIRVLRDDFEDLMVSFVAEERNSSAEECREERSLFSMAMAVSEFSVSTFQTSTKFPVSLTLRDFNLRSFAREGNVSFSNSHFTIIIIMFMWN